MFDKLPQVFVDAILEYIPEHDWCKVCDESVPGIFSYVSTNNWTNIMRTSKGWRRVASKKIHQLYLVKKSVANSVLLTQDNNNNNSIEVSVETTRVLATQYTSSPVTDNTGQLAIDCSASTTTEQLEIPRSKPTAVEQLKTSCSTPTTDEQSENTYSTPTTANQLENSCPTSTTADQSENTCSTSTTTDQSEHICSTPNVAGQLDNVCSTSTTTVQLKHACFPNEQITTATEEIVKNFQKQNICDPDTNIHSSYAIVQSSEHSLPSIGGIYSFFIFILYFFVVLYYIIIYLLFFSLMCQL